MADELVNSVTGEVIAARDVEPGFLVTLYFRNGLVREFLVTKFDPTYHPNGDIALVNWEQSSAVPGDELLQWIDWGEVVMMTSHSLEPR